MIDNIRWFNVGAWYAVNVAKGLKEFGNDVLFVGKGDLPPVREAKKAGLKVDNSLSFTVSSFLSDVIKFLKLLELFPADIVNSHRAEGMNISIAANMLRGGNSPKIIRTRVEIRHPKVNIFNRWAYRRIDGIITPWEEGRKRVVEDMHFPDEKVLLLPGGIDTDKFRPDLSGINFRRELGIGEDVPLAGVVGRLDPVKGHDDFITCAKYVLQAVEDAHFVIIGEEANIKVDELKALAQKEGVTERMHFVGRREDIERCICALDVGVVSSIGSEALSRVALEYMACGLPTVATRVGGLPYLVEDGFNGFLVPVRAPQEMAKCIVQLLKNPSLRKQLGENARKLAVSRYSIPVIAQKTMKFFDSVI